MEGTLPHSPTWQYPYPYMHCDSTPTPTLYPYPYCYIGVLKTIGVRGRIRFPICNRVTPNGLELAAWSY